jgi:hypothetical protein
METYRTRKREVYVVPIATIKSIKDVVGTKTQPDKSRKIHVHYPCIIYFIIEHRSR